MHRRNRLHTTLKGAGGLTRSAFNVNARNGGHILEPQQLGDLARYIPLAPRKVLVQPNADKDTEPVWDRWWLLALFVGIMSAEWFVRRTNQCV